MILDDRKDASGVWVSGCSIDGQHYWTRGGCRYSCIRGRCRVGGWKQKQGPCYIGCTETFGSAHVFIDWAQQQVGYEHDDWQVDKDLLFKDNKVYSKETCVFIPRLVNSFCIRNKSRRGELPVGVSRSSGENFFKARVFIDGQQKRLGSFQTVEAAHAVYKQHKEAHAKVLADRYSALLDPRAYEALMNYTVNIDD